MSEMDGKVVVVTGAGQGIGYAVVKKFAENGATVIATGRTLSKVEKTAEDLKPLDVVPFGMDCGVEEDWQKLVAMIDEKYGKLDVLVNNAGIEFGKDINNMSFEEFKKIESCNVDSVFLGMKYCHDLLKKADAGNIVNISSVASKKSGPCCGNDACYSASKAAVNLLTKHAAFTFAPESIRVNAVLPGGIRTPMVDASLEGVEGAEEFLASINPLPPHLGEPEDLASVVYFVASDQPKYMTGSEVMVDGGMLTH